MERHGLLLAEIDLETMNGKVDFGRLEIRFFERKKENEMQHFENSEFPLLNSPNLCRVSSSLLPKMLRVHFVFR